MKPTDEELEAMAVRWDEAAKMYEAAGVHGEHGAALCNDSAALLRACKGRDSASHLSNGLICPCCGFGSPCMWEHCKHPLINRDESPSPTAIEQEPRHE